jgi:hypothetical protein
MGCRVVHSDVYMLSAFVCPLGGHNRLLGVPVVLTRFVRYPLPDRPARGWFFLPAGHFAPRGSGRKARLERRQERRQSSGFARFVGFGTWDWFCAKTILCASSHACRPQPVLCILPATAGPITGI